MSLTQLESRITDIHDWMNEVIKDVLELGMDIKPKDVWRRVQERAQLPPEAEHWQSQLATDDLCWLNDEINRCLEDENTGYLFNPQKGLEPIEQPAEETKA